MLMYLPLTSLGVVCLRGEFSKSYLLAKHADFPREQGTLLLKRESYQ